MHLIMPVLKQGQGGVGMYQHIILLKCNYKYLVGLDQKGGKVWLEQVGPPR